MNDGTTASPYFFLDRINAPVQLICAGNDPCCPASESWDARDKLVELGKGVKQRVVNTNYTCLSVFPCTHLRGHLYTYERRMHGEIKVFI